MARVCAFPVDSGGKREHRLAAGIVGMAGAARAPRDECCRRRADCGAGATAEDLLEAADFKLAHRCRPAGLPARRIVRIGVRCGWPRFVPPAFPPNWTLLATPRFSILANGKKFPPRSVGLFESCAAPDFRLPKHKASCSPLFCRLWMTGEQRGNNRP